MQEYVYAFMCEIKSNFPIPIFNFFIFQHSFFGDTDFFRVFFLISR